MITEKLIKEGFLMKEAHYLLGSKKKWVKRYFQLSNEHFFEFKKNPTNVRTRYRNILRNITRSNIPEETKQSWCLNYIGVVAKEDTPFTIKIVFHSGQKNYFDGK